MAWMGLARRLVFIAAGVPHAVRLDAYIGGCRFSITQNITISSSVLGRSVSASSSGTFTSRIVGMRARFDLSDKWSFLLNGNIGGFAWC